MPVLQRLIQIITKKAYIDSSFGEVYTKTYISSNYYTKTQSDGNYYTETQSDGNYYGKTYIDTSFGSVYTKTESNTNYFNKTYIDSSFNDVYNKILNPTYVGATFTEDVRVKKKLYIGTDDQAYLEYVGLGTNTNKTVLRINTKSDILNSGENDSINLNSTAGVGVNTDEPNCKLDVSNGTINSTLNTGINFRASNFANSNYVGLASYLNAGNYNPITQEGDSAIIYNGSQQTNALCICFFFCKKSII